MQKISVVRGQQLRTSGIQIQNTDMMKSGVLNLKAILYLVPSIVLYSAMPEEKGKVQAPYNRRLTSNRHPKALFLYGNESLLFSGKSSQYWSARI